MTTIYSDEIDSSSSSQRATTSIINSQSTSPCSAVTVQLYGSIIKSTTSGALTAGVLSTILSISGSAGEMPILSVKAADATSRTQRIVVTCDGVVAFDSTHTASAVTGNGIVVVGQTNAASLNIPLNTIKWRSTLLVQIASSISETDKSIVDYIYALEA